MHSYNVIFSTEAEQDINIRAKYIAQDLSSIETAARYINGIYDFCESLAFFPNRSVKRDDLASNLRITNFKGSSVIAYRIDEENKTVYILRVFNSRQNYKNLLK